MKTLIKVLSVLLLFMVAVSTQAQSRVLVGAVGGIGPNLSFGPSVVLEVPVCKHFEFDLHDTFSPIEEHVALGTGYANQVSSGAIVWVTKNVGLSASGEYSNYSVTKVSKESNYVFGGLVWRTLAWDSPVRFSFNYIRQVANGVAPSGIETNHYQGGSFKFDVRLGCSGPVCYRLSLDNSMGQIWNQGNQNCDGSIGPKTCGDRQRAFTGATAAGFYVEFPRRRDTEDEPF